MSSPSALLKVNYLVMRYLHFESVRGDLQEGNDCASQCQLPLFPVPIPILSSTKSGFLCACYGNTGLWKQKSAQIFCFCALLIYYSGVTAAVVASGRRSRPDVVTGELPPKRCCRRVAAEALLPKRCRRSVTAGALPPEKLRLRAISPPRSLRRLLRRRFCRPAGRLRCCR